MVIERWIDFSGEIGLEFDELDFCFGWSRRVAEIILLESSISIYSSFLGVLVNITGDRLDLLPVLTLSADIEL